MEDEADVIAAVVFKLGAVKVADVASVHADGAFRQRIHAAEDI